ncbi:SDR family oxidoreductase [Prochlorococcus sp. MIT 1300]|uniref:NAD-dependent epimerase/dehydratase family protein n=1 Tax=Prochlorococcus sp. MIT 1300 TaxID=3096218 RepID=UPI002A751941|nr:SDR family oxidoreductase [Prochlorococcus sp. MIT 1300]
MKLLITGGCGYKGSVLIPLLLKKGHEIINVDNEWFGNYLTKHENLQNIKADIRDVDSIPLKGVEAIIHLANIANDPAVELNPTLSWEVNVLAGQQLADKAIREGVQQFIFASSGSVYGLKDEPKVTEDLSLIPISVYNKTKMVAERVFLSYKDQMQIHCIRPATVCGLSRRMRLDVSVNMLTFQALKNQRINVFGGMQTRPNIHIDDIANVYLHFLLNPHLESGCYNAGFENISILEIAKKVTSRVQSEIIITESNDPRSYRQDSTKLLNTGFKPEKTIQHAIDEICEAYESGNLLETDQCYTVKWMKNLNLEGN